MPSPGLELGPCDPQKVPPGLQPLALSPVILDPPKLCCKALSPKSPGGVKPQTRGFQGLQYARCGARTCCFSQKSAFCSASLLIGAPCKEKMTFCLFHHAVCRAAEVSTKLLHFLFCFVFCMKLQEYLLLFP